MIAGSCPALEQLALQEVIFLPFDLDCLSQLPLGVTSVQGITWCRPDT
jgi:hypothetical protein